MDNENFEAGHCLGGECKFGTALHMGAEQESWDAKVSAWERDLMVDELINKVYSFSAASSGRASTSGGRGHEGRGAPQPADAQRHANDIEMYEWAKPRTVRNREAHGTADDEESQRALRSQERRDPEWEFWCRGASQRWRAPTPTSATTKQPRTRTGSGWAGTPSVPSTTASSRRATTRTTNPEYGSEKEGRVDDTVDQQRTDDADDDADDHDEEEQRSR